MARRKIKPFVERKIWTHECTDHPLHISDQESRYSQKCPECGAPTIQRGYRISLERNPRLVAEPELFPLEPTLI